MDFYYEGAPVGPLRCLELLRGITSLSDVERQSWDTRISGWQSDGKLDYHECRTLAVVIAWCTLTEKLVFEVRVGLLGSLSSFAEGGLAPLRAIKKVVAGIPPGSRDVAESEDFEIFAQVLRSRHENPVIRQHVRAGDPIGPARCVQLVRAISSDFESDRWYSSDLVAVLLDSGRLDGDEATTIGAILGWAIAVESSNEVRANFLTSLAALARRDLLSIRTIEQILAELSRRGLSSLEDANHQEFVRARLRLRADG